MRRQAGKKVSKNRKEAPVNLGQLNVGFHRPNKIDQEEKQRGKLECLGLENLQRQYCQQMERQKVDSSCQDPMIFYIIWPNMSNLFYMALHACQERCCLGQIKHHPMIIFNSCAFGSLENQFRLF